MLNYIHTRLHINLKNISIALSLISLIGLAGCGQTTGSVNVLKSGDIKVAPVSAQTIEGNVTLSGIFDADNRAIITTQLPGKVKVVNIKEGTQVKKGDILISLDQSDLQSQLQLQQLNLEKAKAGVDQAKIAYDNAETNFTRNQQLFSAGVISQAQMDQVTMARDMAKSQYDAAVNVGLPSAQTAVDAIQLNIAKTTIISPLDGVVATCSVEAGDNVNPGIPLATVISSGDPVLTGNVPETVLSQIQLGQKVNIQADTVTGTKFTGEISFISPVSVPTGQFFPIKVTVQDPKAQLKPGMTGNASIHIAVKADIVVPNSALFRRDGKNYVYVVKDGNAVKTLVRLGLQGDEVSSITQGVATGDSVIIQGTDKLLDGMKIPA